jgi:hypothetical protein
MTDQIELWPDILTGQIENVRGIQLAKHSGCSLSCWQPRFSQLQYLLIIKFYYSTHLSHLHCRYPSRTCALEREMTAIRYCLLSHGSDDIKRLLSHALMCMRVMDSSSEDG